MDEYKILFQGVLPAHGSTPTVVYTCPPAGDTHVDNGSTVVTNPEAASTFTQTLITSMVVCNTKSSGNAHFTMFLYPDASALASYEGDATYCLVYLNVIASASFATYDYGLYMPPGSILTAKGFAADATSLSVLGIETTT
tara:strand:- start:670 stop:1089 length:420 start_codon:yes stop_codon:yes gene_type:complete